MAKIPFTPSLWMSRVNNLFARRKNIFDRFFFLDTTTCSGSLWRDLTMSLLHQVIVP